ncbi:hypothetical protein AWC05_18235 [Mycobacterium florentinum]|uniref:DUF4386 domain-containing protein n=1 Tax=Mycobacterium florentinum TaxID=292462 RepID=A0A1X1UCL1_MYCFL|nr:hypothetical protein [Mycobacterium florentinum]MCV7412559.1 hypothetical protein [Mycobacterium florentinum]ORV54531.1 hypothetical protein AWC05_18235 [Mycobacterium florentinum]BBX81942.1 hypothetical protein MFLOJ_57290 [Mycobacterium florentinum]
MTAPDALLRDIELSRRIQTFCAWCGPAFVVLLFGGWGLMGGFIPLIPPSYQAEQVAAAYGESVSVHRLGTLLALIGIFLTIPFFFAISMQIRRTELRVPSLAILQFASGIIVTVVLIIPMLLFIGGLFRPERPPELTKLVNDLSYVMLILPWPPIFGQLGALIVAIFHDRSAAPVFPRWLGFFNLWVALLLLPASMIIFFKTGPFAWTGVIGFWIPAAVFGVWYIVMTIVLLRAIRDEAASDAGAARSAA